MPITVAQVLDSSAALLNDASKLTYTYIKQLPYFRIVYELAQNRLVLMGHPTLAEVSAFSTIAAGTAEVTLVDALAIRDVVTYPITIYERAVGATEDEWVLMTRGKWEDLRTAGDTLGSWAWRRGTIKFTAATTNREIKIKYSKVFAAIIDDTTVIEHPNFANFLRYATAGHIAAFVMKDIQRAEMLEGLAESAMRIALATAVKNLQYIPATRPRYFFRGR